MREITRERKNAKRLFEEVSGGEWLKEQMVQVITQGKRAFDDCAMKVGWMLAESFFYKDRNIQDHLPKRYRQEAHRRYRRALELTRYSEARMELMGVEKWLREINESAADSLLEALEEILTLHRLQVPKLLRKSLHSTNPIEAVFSQVRRSERNILRYRGSKMSRRWLGSCLLHAESQFHRVRGYESITEVVANIKRGQQSEGLKNAA